MSHRTICPNPRCQQALQVRAEQSGQTLRCPRCQTTFNPSNIQSSHHGTGATPAVVGVAPPVRTVSRYQLRQPLGQGTYGTVYRAYDPQLDREVALKVLNAGRTDSGEIIERFLREARSAARLHHPNVVAVYDAGQEGETPFIASALIDGPPLNKLLVAGGVEPRRAVGLVVQLLDALAYAHENGILHRDVKPANMLVDRNGHLYLTDFGLAGSTSPDEVRLTRNDAVLGTPAYMPPEQALSQLNRIGPASDLYSAGVVLYHLLTGQLPFDGPLPVVMYHLVHSLPVPPAHLRPGLCPHLNAVCMHLLAKHPEQRPQSARAVAAMLRQWLGSSNALVTPPPTPTGTLASQSLELMRTHASISQHSTLGHETRLPQTKTVPPPLAPETATSVRIAQLLLALSIAFLMLTMSVGGLLWWLHEHDHQTVPTTQTGKTSAPKSSLRSELDAINLLVRNGRAPREHVEQNAGQRLDEWKAAADAGQPEAQWLVGLCHLEGAGVTRDASVAARWFRKAAEQKFAWAQVSLGECYDYGLGEQRDSREAVNWYRQAAEQGNLVGQLRLAEKSLSGVGLDKADLPDAMHWYRQAAAQNHPLAINRLGLFYSNGQGVERDFAQAIEWYQKGIALQCSSPRTNRMFRWNLSIVYSNQAMQARTSDPEEAKRLLQLAINVNEQLLREAPWHVMHQQRLGGNYFILGEITVKQNEELAVQHYRRALALNHKQAAEKLADLYEKGVGVKQDADEARRLRDQAQRKGWATIRVPCTVVRGRLGTTVQFIYVREDNSGTNPLAHEETRLKEEYDAELTAETKSTLMRLHEEATTSGQSFRTKCTEHFSATKKP